MQNSKPKGEKCQEAKAFLSQFQKCAAIIRNKEVERGTLLDIALSVTASPSGERVQTSGNPQRMANAIGDRVDAEAAIAQAQEKSAKILLDIVSVIEQLPTMEYELMHRRYVRGMSYEEIADEYGKSYSWATTTHDRAVAKVQQIIMQEGVCGK